MTYGYYQLYKQWGLNQIYRVACKHQYNSLLMDSQKNKDQQKIKVLTLKDQDTKEEDQYALSLKPLGEGKYAKVYKATNLKDQSKVFAVKVIKIVSEEVKSDYLKELKIIKNLPKCPNIVRTHKQHLQSQNNLYIFQQYCQSGTLASYRAQKLGIPFTQAQIYDLFYQVTNGLIFLLQAGIIHEDVKPVNILKKGPVFKLIDFGVSQIELQYVETTTRKGTISYMPPQKLKVRKFVPSDKSDIYSLGVCLYEIIFGVHPYLKKKTANYKQYLAILDDATLLPINLLMKKLNSTSLKLQNFFRFLEGMIDLNVKKRVSLVELKAFLANTQPFKDMKPIDQQALLSSEGQIKGPIDNKNMEEIFQSVIMFKKEQYQDNLLISPLKKVDPMIQIKRKILQRYKKQQPYVFGVISLLITSIDSIRKQNYRNLNIDAVQKNFLGIDLSTCKVSRFIKYLTYQFSITVIKKFKQRYEIYLQEHSQQQLAQNKAYLQRQFNKFLIECDFQNKELFADELKKRQNNLNLWLQLQIFYQNQVNSTVIIEENKRLDLLCTIYCINIPKIFNQFRNVASIFSDLSLLDQHNNQAQLEKQKGQIINESYLQKGEKIVQVVNIAQKMKKQQLRTVVQQQLVALNKDFLFDIGEESDQIQIMTEQDLL